MSGNRQCARPGCGGAVAALLSYDYAGQRIWLDDPGADSGGHHSALCAAHASRLRAPKGWSCQDRRTARHAPSFRMPEPVEPPQRAGKVAQTQTQTQAHGQVEAQAETVPAPTPPAPAQGGAPTPAPPAQGGAPTPGAPAQGGAPTYAPPAQTAVMAPGPAASAPAEAIGGEAAPVGLPPQRDGGVIAGLTAIAV